MKEVQRGVMGPLAAFSRDTRGVHCGPRQSREQPPGGHRALWHGAVWAPLPSTSANKALSAALGRSWGTGCSPGLPSSLPAPLADTPCRAAVLKHTVSHLSTWFSATPHAVQSQRGRGNCPCAGHALLRLQRPRQGQPLHPCCPPTPPAMCVLQSHPTDGAGFRGLGKQNGKQVRAFPEHRAEVPRLPDPQLSPVVSPATGGIS